MARPPRSPLSWRGRASPAPAGVPSRLPTACSPRPGCSRRGGNGPRPAPGGAEANGRRGGGGRPPSPRRPPYIRARAAPPPRPSGLVASGTALCAVPSRARMPGRTVWRLALLALCLGAAAAEGGDGHRRRAGGKSRRQAQTTSVPQGTPAQGKREYRAGMGPRGQGRAWRAGEARPGLWQRCPAPLGRGGSRSPGPAG